MSTGTGIAAAERGSQAGRTATGRLRGLRAGMVTFSCYPGDPRPRRAVEALIREGMAVDLVCLGEPGAPRKEAGGNLFVTRVAIQHTRGGPLRYGYNYAAFLAISAIRLAAGLRRGRYDLVHVHNMPDVLVFSALIPKLFGAKVVLDQHDPMPELMTTIFGLGEDSLPVKGMKRLERLSLGFADAVVTVNEACRRLFGRRGCPPEKIRIVMNAPDDRLFPLVAASGAGPARRAGRRFVVMYHGSLVDRNGLSLAVAALARLGPAAREIELRIYGKRTPFLDQIEAQARALGVDGSVSYRGSRRVDDLPAEIRECDIGIVPNLRNAFTEINTPTRIFEYLAMGKPVIAPRTGGVTDYFGPQDLLFFEAGDAADLAGRIAEAINDPRRMAAAAAGGQRVFASHTWPRERERYLRLVEELTGRAGLRPPPDDDRKGELTL